MNLLQAQIAHKVNAHFKRERRLMPRAFPVDLFDSDQEIFVRDLIDVFKFRDNQFDDGAFRKLCYDGV